MKTIPMIMFYALFFVAISANSQTGEVYYYPKLIHPDINSAKRTLAGLIEDTNWGKPENVSVLDDRIEFTFKGKKRTITRETIYFSQLPTPPIPVFRSEPVSISAKKLNARITYFYYGIKCGGLYPKNVYNNFFLKDDKPAPSFTFADSYSKQNVPETDANYKQFADYLFFFQRPFLVLKYDSLFNQFKPIAERYRALKVKPPVTEDQRKFIVQANALSQEKNYANALELYNKALDLDQTAYPPAYLNMALLCAQVQNYDGAIFNMKRYLLLVPEAEDARSAQDKIYEWESKIGK